MNATHKTNMTSQGAVHSVGIRCQCGDQIIAQFNLWSPNEDFGRRNKSHVGNNISETYPRRIGQGLNDASCILGSMLSSLMGLSNPAWVSLGNVVSHMEQKM